MIGLGVGTIPPGVGQMLRLVGSTGWSQQTPFDVTFAGAQHGGPPTVGICPGAQQSGRGGIGLHGVQSLLFGPLGAWPAGQQTPVDVTWPARQQAPPTGT